MSFISELERLSVVESFKGYCEKYSPSPEALQQWSRAVGVDPLQIPKNFHKIRRQLGVAAKHGGKRKADGKPGVVRVWRGNFVRPYAPGSVKHISNQNT